MALIVQALAPQIYVTCGERHAYIKRGETFAIRQYTNEFLLVTYGNDDWLMDKRTFGPASFKLLAHV